MEVPKVDRIFFFSTFRLCNDQAKQAKRAIINIQKGVFQIAECGINRQFTIFMIECTSNLIKP
jgi:hypothetical protein